MYYINFRFKDIQYDDDSYVGIFEASDNNVVCKFAYNRKTEQITIWDNNRPVEEITPLPIHWLDWQLKKNGKLNSNEYKISY